MRSQESFQEIERRWGNQIGLLLMIGVALAIGTVLVGGVLYLVQHGLEVPRYNTFVGQPKELTSFTGIFRSAWSGDARGIMQLGVLLLVATPVARMLLSALLFLRQRDWLYVGITCLVLGVLGYGLAGGHL